MQPYFFPYIGYFALVNYVDEFIFFDTPQYINHGWVNRNRILRQNPDRVRRVRAWSPCKIYIYCV